MERYRVILTVPAKDDLRSAASYIAIQFAARIAASRKIKRIRKTLNEKLSFMPQKYRLVANERLAAMGLRRMNVENHIALFSIDDSSKIVAVERIIHALRDLDRILSEEMT